MDTVTVRRLLADGIRPAEALAEAALAEALADAALAEALAEEALAEALAEEALAEEVSPFACSGGGGS